MLTVRREEIEWMHSEGVCEIAPIQMWVDADKKLLGLIWVDTDKSVDLAHNNIRSRLCSGEYNTKKQGNIQRTSSTSQLFSAMPSLEAIKALFPVMIPVSWSNKGKP